MTWNHRVIRFKDKDADGGYRYEFREVFYNDEGEKTGYSNVFMFSEDVAGMQELADRLLKATAEPVLDESDFPNDTPVSDMDMEAMVHYRALLNMGYAVAAFTPEELRGADPDKVMDRMIELGNDVIDDMAWEKEYADDGYNDER